MLRPVVVCARNKVEYLLSILCTTLASRVAGRAQGEMEHPGNWCISLDAGLSIILIFGARFG